jgi:uncharacterized protein YqjF (DUF2071 family)
MFIHYEADPPALQPQVPFELDLREGRAYVSLVAFTMRDLRLSRGGPSLANHGFLNVRTYVRAGNERGIYFLAEWLPHRLCVLLGPRTYGLPYRYGQLDYRHLHEDGRIEGHVRAPEGSLLYRAPFPAGTPLRASAPRSVEQFLMERYIAFTEHRGRRRLFRVDHAPWLQAGVSLDVEEDSLPDVDRAMVRERPPRGGPLLARLRDRLDGSPGRLAMIERWRKGSLVVGAVAWSALAAGAAGGIFDLDVIQVLFLLAPLVIVPLGLGGIGEARDSVLLQPFAAGLAAASFFLPRGGPAAALAAPWLAVCVLLGLEGMPRLRRPWTLDRLLVAAALGFVSVGGLGLVASRAGVPLSGFSDPILLLTGVHFHYTGFGATLLAAHAGRRLAGRARLFAAGGLVAGTPLLAIGFLTSPVLTRHSRNQTG